MKSYLSLALFALGASAIRRPHFYLDQPEDLAYLEEYGWSIDQGQTLTFDVESNLTTGYSWSVSDDCLDILTIEEDYREHPNPNNLLGLGGY